MRDPLSDSYWKTEGKCFDLGQNDDDKDLWESFFAETVRERQEAIEFCEGCPVQKRCLRFALETQQLWGVWGGRDESELRRDLWMNSNGTIGSRARAPRCPWCRVGPQTLEITDTVKHQITCTNCDFSWKSETSRMGLEEYLRGETA